LSKKFKELSSNVCCGHRVLIGSFVIGTKKLYLLSFKTAKIQ
jgi:hypothetical protein